MTVPTETIEISYPGSGNETRTEFPFQFPVLDEDHLVVKVIDLSTSPNTEMRLIKNTHYEVHGTGNTGGGHVRLIDLTTSTGNTRLTSQFNLLIQRKVPVLQEMDLQNQGGFIAENHERKFDYLTMIDQQLQAELDRCVKTTEPYGQTADRLLPSVAAVVAGMYSDIIDIDSDYTVAQTNNGNLLRVDTSGGDVTITLPDTDDLGADMRFSAIKWTDDDNAVIIRSQPTESINNGPHIRIDKEYYSSIVVSDSASDMWVALSSDTPPMKDIVLDTFTADNDDQASYTLSYAPGNKNNTRLFINGEYVKKGDYSVSGTTLTLNATLAATIEEDDEVEVFYNRPLPLGVPAEGSVGSVHLQDGSVTTDELADNSVTLSKLAHGSANKIIGYDGSGVPAEIAKSEIITGSSIGADRMEDGIICHTFDRIGDTSAVTETVLDYHRIYVPENARRVHVMMESGTINVHPGFQVFSRISIGTVLSNKRTITGTMAVGWWDYGYMDVSGLSGWQDVRFRGWCRWDSQSLGCSLGRCSLAFVE